MSETLSGWRVCRDPARPTWPGVLIVPNEPNDWTFIQVASGHPTNFAESAAMAYRIVAHLNADDAMRGFASSLSVPEGEPHG